jgi:hypothetical protein
MMNYLIKGQNFPTSQYVFNRIGRGGNSGEKKYRNTGKCGKKTEKTGFKKIMERGHHLFLRE